MQAEDGGDAPSVASQARGTTPGSKMPRYSTFTQQEMWACRPVLTPAWAVGIFMLLGVIFIPLGAASLSATRSVVEVSQRYDADCISGTTSAAREQTLMDQGGNGVTCNVTLTAPSKMEHPVFMYYEIKGMYQNHRRYVSSRSDPQMRGVGITTKTLKDCKPELDYPDLSDVPAEDRGQLIVPCGLIAWSMFNDTYRVYKGSQIDASQELTSPTLTSSGIAWPSDKDKRYSDITGNSNIVPALRGGESITGQLNQNEHLMVWMRTATTPRFRKLWAIINTDFQKGDQVTVFIENKYNTYRFNGEKSIVLSTSSWMGGANDTVGIICLVVGCLSVLCSIVFFTLVNVHPRKVGDLAFLSWNQS